MIQDQRKRPRPGSPGPIGAADERIRERVGMDRLADRWSSPLIAHLAEGPQRFGEIRSAMTGISEKMLTQTLRGLERDGLVDRKDYGTVPPRVEYSLTALGHSLREPLAALCHWGQTHGDEVESARENYDRTHARR